jgi:eukaryotic-like serine/threonine-protein kinase
MTSQPFPLDPTGSVLASRYELRALLGRGGMGRVYEAADLRLDRTVAVKILRAELAADRRFVARFHREARIAARLDDPRIVHVHDFGAADGHVFIVMEHVAGRTLARAASDEGPMDSPKAARIGADIATALAHAHARGVVHRDVAPGNVMLTPEGDVKVLDFGIARAARGSGQAASSSVHGTIAYAAPEVLAGADGDARVDVYGLGAVLYELLTGAPPFRGSEDHAIAQRLRVERPVPPRAWNPAIDKELDRVVVRCLRRTPTERHGDVDALARELRTIAQRAPSRTEPLHVLATAPIPRPVTTDPLPVVATSPATRSGPNRRRRRPVRVLTFLAAAATAAGALAVAIPGFVALSAGVQTTPRGPDPIPAPSGLEVIASCDGWMSTGVDLSWTPPQSADAIQVWRWDPGAEDFLLIGSVGPDATFVRDADLGVDVTYRYRLRAVRGPYVSPWSNEAEVGTPLLCVT